jgi:uncharacterized protein (TIGR02266 family)
MGIERRVHPRIPLKLLVQFRLQDMDEFMREYAVNLSVGGMFIRTSDPHPRESLVYLQFTLVAGDKLIEGLGKVVHVNPPTHEVPGMGIEFVNLDDESREFIDSIVQEREGDDAPAE